MEALVLETSHITRPCREVGRVHQIANHCSKWHVSETSESMKSLLWAASFAGKILPIERCALKPVLSDGPYT
jgi:hypothetical protein